jgi:RNA 3'-phosphate cyclase
MLEIDGSYGEGGGQMMRSAVAFSCLTRTPFRMINIRAGREKPGLKAQHVHVLKAAMKFAGATVAGAKEGSAVVDFDPGRPRGGTFEIDIGTAGSITLVMQTLLPALLFAGGRSVVTVRGGTDVAMSPPFDYFREVIVPHAAPFADELAVDMRRRGFYPKGGGEVRLLVRPKHHGTFEEIRAAVRRSLPPIDLTRAASAESIDVYSVAHDSLEPNGVVERQAAGAMNAIKHARLRAHKEYARAFSIGTAVTVVARFAHGAIGGDALGERGKRAEDVGREAAEMLKAALDTGAPVDEHLADHLVPWLALRGGSFRASALSEHTKTNCWLVERFIGPSFTIDEATRTVSALGN